MTKHLDSFTHRKQLYRIIYWAQRTVLIWDLTTGAAPPFRAAIKI